MSDVKWIKIATSIFDDEKILIIESLPSSDSILVIWLKLLTLAGKQNNSGVFMLNDRIAYTDEMLATIFRRDINTVRMALRAFHEYGMIEIIEGVITIPNWSKHQNLDAIEKKKEYQKTYMQKRRQEQKMIACKTNSKSNSKTNSESNVSCLEEELEEEKELERDKEEREEEKKKKKKETVKTVFEAYASGALLETLFEFKEMRQKQKASLTIKAANMLISKLESMASDDYTKIKILEQSIMNGWKGIFEIKQDNKQKKSPTQDPLGIDMSYLDRRGNY